MGIDKIGLVAERQAVVIARQLQIAVSLKNIGEIVIAAGIIRVFVHQAAENGARVVFAPGGKIHGRQIVLVGGIVRRHGQRPFDIADGGIMGAQFMRNEGYQMEPVGLIGHVAQRVFSLRPGLLVIALAIGLNAGLQGVAHIFERRRAEGALFARLIIARAGAGAGVRHGRMMPCQPYFLVNGRLRF